MHRNTWLQGITQFGDDNKYVFRGGYDGELDRLIARMRSDTAISASLLKQARMRAGLSQAELGERSGKAKVQIGRWETGVVAPSLDTLLELLRACDFDLPLQLEPYQRVDDRRLVELQQQSPGDRVERMMRRARRKGQ